MQSELVQDSQNGLVDDVIDHLWVTIERRHRRENHDAHARKLQHIFEVNVAQGRLAHDQDQFAAFLEHHVGGAVNESVAMALRDGGERSDAARADHHTLGHKGAAGNGRALVLRCIVVRGHLVDLLNGVGRLVDQCAGAPVAEHEMGLDLGMLQDLQEAHPENGARGPGDPDDQTDKLFAHNAEADKKSYSEGLQPPGR